MRVAWTVVLICLAGQGIAQTYYQDVAPILERNCQSCHYPGGIGPFSLLTYEEVKARGSFIVHVTRTRYMPPWKADPSFRHFRNEKMLTEAEIKVIGDWVERGMPKGKKPKNHVITASTPGAEPDLTLRMTSDYSLSDKAIEDFRFFVLPTNLREDKKIAAIEFIPGNRKQVHHSRLMTDTTQRIRGIDGMSELDPNVRNFQTIPLVDEFMYGWVPGNQKIFFPPGTAKHLFKGTDLVLNIHYSPSAKPQKDQSVVNLYFAKGPVDREVYTLTLRENDIVNQPFYLPAESTPSFFIRYKVQKDISLISIMPHMHFVGKSMAVEAITPTGEQIPLVRVNKWDFNWQTTYQFKNMIKLPAGSQILVSAAYDNTSANPANPNHPSKGIGYGWRSTDEMCNVVIYYVDYREGDELVEY